MRLARLKGSEVVGDVGEASLRVCLRFLQLPIKGVFSHEPTALLKGTLSCKLPGRTDWVDWLGSFQIEVALQLALDGLCAFTASNASLSPTSK